jgi:hypothetical protein
MFEQPFLQSAHMNNRLGNMACRRKKEFGSKLYFWEIRWQALILGDTKVQMLKEKIHIHIPLDFRSCEKLFYYTLLGLCITVLCLLYLVINQ